MQEVAECKLKVISTVLNEDYYSIGTFPAVDVNFHGTNITRIDGAPSLHLRPVRLALTMVAIHLSLIPGSPASPSFRPSLIVMQGLSPPPPLYVSTSSQRERAWQL